MIYYAHTAVAANGAADPNKDAWQPLRTHLGEVAKLAKDFAGVFGGGDEAQIAGLLHDLGKYADRFQARLSNRSIRGINHWAAGTAAANWLRASSVAFAVDGHHTGIPARNESGAGLSLRSTLASFNDPSRRLELTGQCPESLDDLLARFANDGLAVPAWTPLPRKDLFAEALRIRMLFSCLVDADFLDTEKHFDPEQSGRRIVPGLQAKRALKILKHCLGAKPSEGPVNGLRRRLLEDCLRAAAKPPGLFTLTAPTGSGKTLASLAFALQHILHRNAELEGGDPQKIRRIIVVIPYTSIIEQTAKVYRELFSAELGEGYALEHHSAVDPSRNDGPGKGDNEDEQMRRARLAAENWEAPLIVTTSVQFFESLFSNRPSDCRKLHNIARSVVLFDEVQTLPTRLVPSLLSAVQLLTRYYGVTAAFMTATQPAFASLKNALPYGWNPESIATNETAMAEGFRRTRIELPRRDEEVTWPEVAAQLIEEPQCLCVVNTTRDARELFRLVRDAEPEDAFHLSARMCPAHRLEKLKIVRQLLLDGLPCRLISTQLIEAGVDVDFPAAWRAVGPLDSIIQTAGRCNREGTHPEPRPVTVFRPADGDLPLGAYKTATQKTEEFLARHPDACLHQPEIYQKYFSELYEMIGPDSPDKDPVFTASKDLNFPKAAHECKLVDSDTRAVLVKWKRGAELANNLEQYKFLTASECREAQRFSVNLYQREFTEARGRGYVYKPADDWDFWVWNSDYSEDFGLGHLDAESFCQ